MFWARQTLTNRQNDPAHFDLKTDVDDVHSVAGVATMLADPRFSKVRYHAVAGTYGIQEGLYVPAEGVFDDEPDQTPAEKRASMTWAKRLKHIFSTDIETCSKCGGDVHIMASIA